MVSDLRSVDRMFVLLNLFLLLLVSFLPFPTKILGTTFLLVAISFWALWAWAARHRHLIRSDVPDAAIRARDRMQLVALPLFAVPCVVALWTPIGAVALDGLLVLSMLALPSGARG